MIHDGGDVSVTALLVASLLFVIMIVILSSVCQGTRLRTLETSSRRREDPGLQAVSRTKLESPRDGRQSSRLPQLRYSTLQWSAFSRLGFLPTTETFSRCAGSGRLLNHLRETRVQ